MLINYSYQRMQLKITRENILYLNGKRTALGVFVFFFFFFNPLPCEFHDIIVPSRTRRAFSR